MLQLTGYYIQLYAADDGTVDADSCNMAIKSARQILDEDIFDSVLNPLSEKDKTFLKAMAQIVSVNKGKNCEGGEGVAPEISIADIQNKLQISPGYAQTYKQRLIDAGVIESPARGKLRFAVPYLGEYLVG